MTAPPPEQQLEIFRSRTVDLVSEDDLLAKLRSGRPLRIKFGCDPSAPDLHVGHTVPLAALRELQALGHRVIFLVGDFTAMIGDPTGRSRTRPALSREEVEQNARTYCEQVDAVLDASELEIRFNSEWMDRMTPSDFVKLTSCHTVARMLERDDFKQRHRDGVPIAIHEFLYPLIQAYDSVALEADVEVGGTDQLFNLLLGREIQRAYQQDPQVVLTFPLLEGTDGVEKMSKSLGNAIGIREAPNEIYGKVMSIPDAILGRWVEFLAGEDAELQAGRKALEAGEGHPRDLKAALARRLVARFHSPEAATGAEAHFDRVFRQREVPDDVPELEVPGSDGGGPLLTEILKLAGFAGSGSEGRRLIQQGGVRVDTERILEVDARLPVGSHLLQVGKRRFARVRVRG